jgi:hypothetical protein
MNLETWARVRRKVLVEGRSKRSVMAEEGLHWETLQKMLAHAAPPGYRQSVKRGRKIDAYADWVRGVLEADGLVPRKQRHSAKRIFDRLRAERGYEGGYTAVKELVAGILPLKQEVFVPLSHRPGEAQVDFGHALVKVGGTLPSPTFLRVLPRALGARPSPSGKLHSIFSLASSYLNTLSNRATRREIASALRSTGSTKPRFSIVSKNSRTLRCFWARWL